MVSRSVLARNISVPKAVMALLALVLAGVVFGGWTDPAHAKTFTVNSTKDDDDLDFPNGTFDGSSDGKCLVPTAGGAEVCTLRAAIQAANKYPGADTITFNGIRLLFCDASGVCTITPATELPAITKPVTIDGYTLAGAEKNTLTEPGKTNASPKIELDGTNAGPEGDGLVIEASNVVVRGLVINSFANSGLFFSSGTGHRIEGNFIGTDPGGTSDEGNGGYGVSFFDTDGSTIGGASLDDRNLISGNGSTGVSLASGSSGNKVMGNLIGTNKDGTNTPNNLSNDAAGVRALGSKNIIGDSDPGDGSLTNAANTIAFNIEEGVRVVESDDTGNRILGNSIHSNGRLGIELFAGDPPVFGVTPNDLKDPDTGANRLQNYPVLDPIQKPLFSTSTTITGDLNSTPSTRKVRRTFIIQFFSNPSTDPNEGKTFLGQIQVKTDGQGNASDFGFSAQGVSEGEFITATATNKATGDTSEFSAAQEVKGLVINPNP